MVAWPMEKVGTMLNSLVAVGGIQISQPGSHTFEKVGGHAAVECVQIVQKVLGMALDCAKLTADGHEMAVHEH